VALYRVQGAVQERTDDKVVKARGHYTEGAAGGREVSFKVVGPLLRLQIFEIGGFLDEGFKAQAGFNLDALEKAIGRKLEDRDEILAQQHQAARWTYIGSGMVHERFMATLESMSPSAAARIAEAAPIFA
jgi:hypothetical protein